MHNLRVSPTHIGVLSFASVGHTGKLTILAFHASGGNDHKRRAYSSAERPILSQK